MALHIQEIFLYVEQNYFSIGKCKLNVLVLREVNNTKKLRYFSWCQNINIVLKNERSIKIFFLQFF